LSFHVMKYEKGVGDSCLFDKTCTWFDKI
jgi:hypothetical protein